VGLKFPFAQKSKCNVFYLAFLEPVVPPVGQEGEKMKKFHKLTKVIKLSF
jgi:hypothetical protein